MCRLPRRPAVSTTVRWPALTPLKRKGNQHFTVDHSYSAVLKQKCVNLWKLIPQGGWSQMDPQRSSLLLGWQTPPTTAATQLGEDDLRDALCSKPKTWNLIFLLSSQRLTVSGRLSSCGRVHSSVPPPVSLAPTRLHSLHLPPAPWTLKTSSPPDPSQWAQTARQQLEELQPSSHRRSVPVIHQCPCKPRLCRFPAVPIGWLKIHLRNHVTLWLHPTAIKQCREDSTSVSSWHHEVNSGNFVGLKTRWLCNRVEQAQLGVKGFVGNPYVNMEQKLGLKKKKEKPEDVPFFCFLSLKTRWRRISARGRMKPGGSCPNGPISWCCSCSTSCFSVVYYWDSSNEVLSCIQDLNADRCPDGLRRHFRNIWFPLQSTGSESNLETSAQLLFPEVAFVKSQKSFCKEDIEMMRFI